MSIDELKIEIEEIKKRNQKVEVDKAWETSWIRKIAISFLTYIVVVIFFYIAHLPKPFINALVPAGAFIVSTLTISILKAWWVAQRH